MTRMPTFEEIRGDWERGVQAAEERLTRQPRPPAPAFTPRQQVQPSQPEVPMSVGTALHRIAAVAEKIGEDADTVLIAITDHPEGVEVLRAVAAAMGVPLPVGAISAGATAFKIAVTAFEAGKAAAQNGQQADGAGVQPAQATAHPAVI